MTHPVLPLVSRRTFLSNIDYNGPGGCWLWKRTKHRKGYGITHRNDGTRHLYAHRVSFAIFRGEPGLVALDHICRVRSCVNPYHLRRTTTYENSVVNSELSGAAINARKSHCIRGHDLHGDNVRIYIGRSSRPWRVCRACERWHSRNQYHERKRTG